LERATGIEPVLPAWESKSSAHYFQYLQDRLAKTSVHATHIVHALPDLRIAAGRLRDGPFRLLHVLGPAKNRDHRDRISDESTG
jgi:hypothetical protein